MIKLVRIDLAIEGLVKEKTIYESRIDCQWTDGKLGCCEVWKYQGPFPIS